MRQVSRRPSRETIQARHNLPPADAAKRAVRLSNLKKLAKSFEDLDTFAIAVELETSRVEEMLQGKAPISSEMAMHLEDSLNLPGGWMESTDSKYAKADAGKVLEQKRHTGAAEVLEPETPKAPSRASRPPPPVVMAAITTITGTPQKVAVSKTGAPVQVVTKLHRAARPPVTETAQAATPAAVEPAAPPKVWTKPRVKAKPAAKAAPAVKPASVKAAPRVAPPEVKAAGPEKAASVTSKIAKPTPDKEMQQNIRRMNLALLTENKGEKARMSRALGIHASQLSLKLAGRRVMSDKFCGKIEAAYGLATGWMAEARLALPPAGVVPLKDFVLVAAAPAVAKVPPTVAPPRPTPAGAAAPMEAAPSLAPPAPALAAPVSLAAGHPSPLARALSEVILYRASTGALADAEVTELLCKLMQAA